MARHDRTTRRPRAPLLVLLLALACEESGPRPETAVVPAADPTSPPTADAPVAAVAAVAAAVAAVPPALPDGGEIGGLATPPADDLVRGDRAQPMVPQVELTAADVLAALERVAAGKDELPGFSWNYRAAALIERDPKLRQGIVDRLREPSCAYKVREFGVEMLVARSTTDIQAALRQVLGDPVVRADPSYWMLVNRLGNVQPPDDETIELTLSLRSSDPTTLRYAATATLGRQVATLIDRKRPAAAAKLVATLKSALKAEADPGQQALLLEALGVGGHPSSRGYIRGFARSKSAELRRAAAKGMIRDESREAAALLLELLVDPDLEVQAAAVDSLVERPLNAAQQRQLHTATITGRVTPKFDAMLATLISRRLQGDARRTALELLLARNPTEDWVRRNIEEALASG